MDQDQFHKSLVPPCFSFFFLLSPIFLSATFFPYLSLNLFANAISPLGSPGSCGGWTPAGHFNTTLTPMDRSTKQKNNKETQTLNDTMDQRDLIDIYRTLHPKTMNFTFLSSAHGAFSRIDHILGHKSCLGKSKKKLKLFQAFFLTTMQ